MSEQKNNEAEIETLARAFCGQKITCSECVNMRSNVFFTKKQDCYHFIFAKKMQ